MELWIDLARPDTEDGASLQSRIAGQLRALMLGGHLTSGSRLPATRELAQQLGVARVTVEAAYARLEAEGYLQRRVGAGSFVSPMATPLSPPLVQPCKTPPPLSTRGAAVLTTARRRDHPERLPFNAGCPDLRAFPHALWQRLLAQCVRRHGPALGDYGDPQGYLPLREAISDWLAQSRGVRCTPEQVVVLTSSQQAIQLAATLLLDPGDAAALEDPGYLGARAALSAAGARLQPIAVDAEGADPASLPVDLACRLIFLTPSHQFPLGHALSLPRRLAWLARARESGAWIIEDDYDGEYQYERNRLPALQSLDRDGRVIYVGTFSKTLMPSLRLAYMVLPGELAEQFTVARHGFDGHSAQLMQAVAAEFIQRGHFTSHLRQMRQLYRSRRDLLLECLGPFDDVVTPLASETGLQFAMRVPAELEAAVHAQATDAGLVLRRLSTLHLGEVHAPGWLMGFAALENQVIREATARLGTLLRRCG
jgi:GntR family transcriptional regulator/MocR family aminotransferase